MITQPGSLAQTKAIRSTWGYMLTLPRLQWRMTVQRCACLAGMLASTCVTCCLVFDPHALHTSLSLELELSVLGTYVPSCFAKAVKSSNIEKYYCYGISMFRFIM